MKKEKYQPVLEEIKKAEDLMTHEQKIMTEIREKTFNTKEAKGFTPIDPKTVNSDLEFRSFLLNVRISKSKRGDGVFISGPRDADTAKFCKFGIPVSGALIIPARENAELEVERISLLVDMLKKDVEREKRTQDDIKKERFLKIAEKEFDKRIAALQAHVQEFKKIEEE